MRRIGSRWLATVVVVAAAAIVAGSCNGSREGTPGQSASAEAAAAADSRGSGASPEPDLSGIEVCVELPAATLAAALGLPAAAEARTLADDPAPNCSYRFDGDGGVSRVDVFLRGGSDLDWALRTAREFDREVIEVAGLGERAYRKRTLDGWWEVWVRRPDGSVVQTTAREPELAEEAANAALGEIF